nr:RICIN domain-containing protein [Streptomyces violaceochromogenes]
MDQVPLRSAGRHDPAAGRGTMTSVRSGLSLEASNAGTANGTRGVLSSCNGGAGQRWAVG